MAERDTDIYSALAAYEDAKAAYGSVDLPAFVEARPEWSFVFVGKALEQPGLTEMLARIGALRNVHFLGGKSSHELAAYPQHFDVCMLPYCVDDYTKYIDPLKLSEYMASGRPAVGTPILPLRPVSDLVTLAETPAEWRQAISASLLPDANSPDARAKRQSWAKARTWDVLVDSILAKVEAHLGAIPTNVPAAVLTPGDEASSALR